MHALIQETLETILCQIILYVIRLQELKRQKVKSLPQYVLCTNEKDEQVF
jgi:hypothetical protein